MADVPMRPLGANIFGMFHTPPNGDYDAMYSSWNFERDWKNQIDAAASIGANCMSYFGSINLTGTLANYLGQRRQIVEYLASKKMYALPYASCTPRDWGAVSYETARSIIVADAAVMGQYPNVAAYMTCDEPWIGSVAEGGSIPNATVVANVAAQYAQCKAVVPPDLPVCAAPNPGGNQLLVFEYTGAFKDRIDSVAAYNDIWVFHPFYAATLAQTVPVRAAYPNKEIVMPSAVLSLEGDTDIASRAAAITGLVGANGIRGYCWFIVRDFATFTYGIFAADSSTPAVLTPRPIKTTAFSAGISSIHPQIQRSFSRGKPRLSNMKLWGYK